MILHLPAETEPTTRRDLRTGRPRLEKTRLRPEYRLSLEVWQASIPGRAGSAG